MVLCIRDLVCGLDVLEYRVHRGRADACALNRPTPKP